MSLARKIKRQQDINLIKQAKSGAVKRGNKLGIKDNKFVETPAKKPYVKGEKI